MHSPCGGLKPWMAQNFTYTVLSYAYRPMMEFNLKLGSVRPSLRGEPHKLSRPRQAGKREVPAPSCETLKGTPGVQILRLLYPLAPLPVLRYPIFSYGGPSRGNVPAAVHWVYVQLCLLLLCRGCSPATPYPIALQISRQSPLTCSACLTQFTALSPSFSFTEDPNAMNPLQCPHNYHFPQYCVFSRAFA